MLRTQQYFALLAMLAFTTMIRYGACILFPSMDDH